MIEAAGIVDAAERERALDPARSFIVQAPAGSGKTELLIRRLLVLLARVDAPEEIVAVTFTRKAAGEMRARVVAALSHARAAEVPPSDHQRATWRLARAVLDRDARAGWGLTDNPGRLRIQTIDSLNASLARQLPVLSGFGLMPESVEMAAPLYREAAARTIAQLEQQKSPIRADLERLLSHRNNDVGGVSALIERMLARRDQWLRHVVGGASVLERVALERALRNLVEDELAALRASAPMVVEGELTALARGAAANLESDGRTSAVRQLATIAAWPGAAAEEAPLWSAIAQFLLTQQGTLRRKVQINDGFPAPGTAHDAAEKRERESRKRRMESLLTALEDEPDFIVRLDEVRRLPPPTYPDSHWAVLEALTRVLPMAAAELDLLFGERRQVDFPAVAQRALLALGTPEDPTDLALALDYRIRHLLVDEFQDTSAPQIQLLERLTAGWQPGDGRTLFVVGDPMQSIYRFREADVALYLQARHEGIGSVALEPITLQANFRSQAGIVDWVNAAFARVLPRHEDRAAGAVPYAPSSAVHPPLPDDAVQIHPRIGKDSAAEAARVVQLIDAARIENPSGTVAILVRGRGHLAAIVPALRAAGLRFQALDIDPLGSRPVVEDLHALTRALLHPADRLAWLAVLRAPWCGALLADLEALVGVDRARCVWDLIGDAETLQRCSPDARLRIDKLRDRLAPFVTSRARESVRRRVEGAWLAIGGPAVVRDAEDLDDAAAFLDLLEAQQEASDLLDFAALRERIAALYAKPDPLADGRLQIMTLHKAKGLEFDTVIVPGLGARPREDEVPLLRWLVRPREHRAPDLLLAPIASSEREDEPIGAYLKHLEMRRAGHEDGRLLYVAATRARRRLHLLGHGQVDARGVVQPTKGTLLDRLWPAVQSAFEGLVAVAPASPVAPPVIAASPPAIRRLPLGWTPPAPEPGVIRVEVTESVEEGPADVEFSWASETAKHIGTVVHRGFQILAEDGWTHWNADRVKAALPIHRRDLQTLGVPDSELPRALQRVQSALTAAFDDPRARWIFSASHRDARNELRLTGVVGHELVNVALDRTFVDAEGTRWIVDYKTGRHEGADPDGFLDTERERYREQLERYAVLMRGLDPRPIRLALYFPLMLGWREWAAQDGSGN
ncbi:MAG: UvrD-helicase domain-containing protein [Burkholderiales bacterium]|nr:UvrD-helicase domain-containing protein [Burkholderiales bacterium]